MKASETKVEDFLSGNKTQFVIPVYQRNYEWTDVQCQQLFDDIISVSQNPEYKAHFIGSIVYIHDDVYTSSSLRQLTIIDGQQRLTTITLIYLAILHLAIELGDESLQSEIRDTYLINRHQGKAIKLKVTENNLQALEFLLRADVNEEYKEFSKIINNFNFFKARVTKDNLSIVQAGLSKLMFVEVSLERGKDDPQRIFESLNSTGLELSQADLIRNYILMDLGYEQQEEFYNSFWKIIEVLAINEKSNQSMVSDFIRDFLTLKTSAIPNKRNVYMEFKKNYPNLTIDSLKNVLVELKNLVKYYNKLINPSNEDKQDIRIELEYIQRLEINVCYPFLIKVYDDYSNNIINKQIFIQILQLIQSYVYRRFIVGLPTNALNKTFMNLYKAIDVNQYLYSIQKTLIQKIGNQRLPNDLELIDALKIKDVYNIQRKNIMYLLERLENWNNQEVVDIINNDNITIEHIFPQNPDAQWKEDVKQEDYQLLKTKYLHTVSNLTLSGNNATLGNKSFIKKRDLLDKGYKDSRLWLNKYISSLEKWDIEALHGRFDKITDRFVKIWPFPDIKLENDLEDVVNIFNADDPTNKKLDYAIFQDEYIDVKTVSQLYSEIIKKLFTQKQIMFLNSNLLEKFHLVEKSNKSSLREPLEIYPNYYIESHFNSHKKFRLLKKYLEFFDLEDALFIKYQ